MAWTEFTRSQHRRKTKRYPSDLTDAEWKIVRQLLPGRNHLGRPRKVELRRVWNAIQYLAAAGCAWSLLPRDFPPVSTSYARIWVMASWEGRRIVAGVEPARTSRKGAIRHERRYHDHSVSPARFRRGPADRDRARRCAAHVGRGAEGGGRCLRRQFCRRDIARRASASGQAWARTGTSHSDGDRRARYSAPESARPGWQYGGRRQGALHL
ncbi:transposase, partial [Alterinioella nitratireducens]